MSYLKEYNYLNSVSKLVKLKRLKEGENIHFTNSNSEIYVLISGRLLELELKTKVEIDREIESMRE